MSFNNRGGYSDCPCKGCDRRTVTCHGVCREYQDWKKEVEARNAARNAEMKRLDTMSNAKKKAIWRKLRYSRQPPLNNHRER